MTNTEKLITHIKTRLAQESYTVLDWELTMLGKMLKELPCYDEDKAYDIICGEDEVRVFDDDRLYMTFDSTELHIGDEVVKEKNIAIVTMIYFDDCYVMYSNGACEMDSISNFQRTGRNFPAIEKILKIIAKEKKDAE